MHTLKFYVLALIVLVSFRGYTQTLSNTDSLNHLLLKEDDQVRRGYLYLELAKCYEYSDYLKSYDYIIKARGIAEKNKEERLNSNINLFFSNLLIKQGKYNEALQYLHDELNQSKADNQEFKYVGLLINIGAIYYQIKDYDKALSNFITAKELVDEGAVSLEDKQYPQIFIGVHNNIANVYDELNDNPKALTFYSRALDVAKEHNEYEHIGVISKNMGDLYVEMDQSDLALPYIKESIEVRKKLKDYSGLSTSYYVLGLYYFKTKNEVKALESYRLSLDYGLKANVWFSISETALTLSNFYKEKGDYKSTYDYFQIYNQYEDSLMTQNSEKQRMALEFDFKLKQHQNEWKAQQQKERLLHYVMGIALLVLASYLLLLFYLSKGREKRIGLEKKNLELENLSLEQDLKAKKKELTTNVMYLVRKNELMKEVSKRLMDSIGNLKPENQKIIQSIMLELQQGLDNDIWDEFEIRFNQVHSEFYKNLREKYPDLTPNEVKLSAFLRLNMSSKEISAITHQSIRSIEVARTRLRKKLKLTNTDTGLINFLNTF